MAIVQPYCKLIEKQYDEELEELGKKLRRAASSLFDEQPHPLLRIMPVVRARNGKNESIILLDHINRLRTGEIFPRTKWKEPPIGSRFLIITTFIKFHNLKSSQLSNTLDKILNKTNLK